MTADVDLVEAPRDAWIDRLGYYAATPAIPERLRQRRHFRFAETPERYWPVVGRWLDETAPRP